MPSLGPCGALRRLTVAVALVAAALSPLRGSAQPESDYQSTSRPHDRALYVFGDSLSDTGNDHILTTVVRAVPSIPPSKSPWRSYYDGRFSNGPVAMEWVWRGLTRDASARLVPSLGQSWIDPSPGVSYAFGGSASGYMTTVPGSTLTVPGLQVQVQVYAGSLWGRRPDKSAVHAVWTGANDYLFYGATDPAAVVRNIERGLRQLYVLGARSFLVPNLPDLGTTPIAQAQQAGPALTKLTIGHNAALAATLARLQREFRNATIIPVDMYSALNRLAAQGTIQLMPPALEVLAPGTSDCLLRDPRTCTDVNLGASLPPLAYWDFVHPTALVHELMGRIMLERMRQ